MAELKIKADSGGGTVSLKGPATTTSNAAVQLTLPVDDGTSGQYLKTDGSGALSWATVASATADVTDGNFKVLGAEGGDSAIEIHADEGDDNADKWRLNVSAGDGTLAIQNYAGGGWENSLLLYGNGAAKFYKDNTLMCETSNDGLAFPDGKGISFAATSDGGTATPDETLKDYEEGEWTPVWKSGSNEFTHDRQQGYYTRIGNLCYAWWNYTWTGKGSASGNMTIAGFPFQGKSNSGQFYFVGINSNSAWTADDYSDLTWQVLLTGNETSAIGGFQAGAGNYLTAADCNSSGLFFGNITYLIND